MTLQDVLDQCQQAGLTVTVADGKPKLLGPAKACTPELLAALREYRTQIIARFTPPAPRRVVLLAGGRDSEILRVLEEPAAIDGIRRTRELAAQHPGNTVALEWLSKQGWVRFTWISYPFEEMRHEDVPAVA